jgi:YD repeat-containing protein
MKTKRFIVRSFRLTVLAALVLALPLVVVADRAQYLYDDLGRLQAVIDAEGNAAIYHYDAVGNLLSITSEAVGQTAILSVSPTRGGAGSTVVIQGVGFSPVSGLDQVTFGGGATADVTSATATKIVTTVPDGALTGTITVTTPTGSAVSPQTFEVLPVITAIAPSFATRGNTIAGFTITGTGLTGATTVAFSPPTGITVNNSPSANAEGTTATVSITVSAGAPTGGRVVTITTAEGSSDNTMTAANTFTVVSNGVFSSAPLVRVYVTPPPDASEYIRVFIEPLPNPVLSPFVGVQVNPP